MATATKSGDVHVPRLPSDQVLKIARLDAEQAYRDLSRCRISLALEEDGWHIDHQLKDPATGIPQPCRFEGEQAPDRCHTGRGQAIQP